MGIPLAALSIKQPEDLGSQLGKMLAIKGAQQQQAYQAQAQPLEIQQQQQQIEMQKRKMADLDAETKAMNSWDSGKLEDVPNLIKKNGGSYEAYLNAEKAVLAHKELASKMAEQDATTGSKNIETYRLKADQIAGEFSAIKDVPDEQVHDWALGKVNSLAQNQILDPQHAQHLQQQIQQTQDPALIRQGLGNYSKSILGASALATQAQKEAETRRTESETKKTEMETAQGGPVAQQEMTDWLAKNPGKGPSDYEIAMKKIVPAFNFNLQQGGGGNAPLDAKQEATVQAIMEGRMSQPSSFALKTPYWQKIMGEVFTRDPNWSEQRAQLRKSYTVGKQSTEINAINTAMGHVGNLSDAVDALKNGDVQVLNRIANTYGVQTGATPVTTFNTIVHRVGPEITKAYVGAGGGEGERGTTEKDFSPSLSPEQLKSNIGITAKLLRSKISSLENQWDQNAPPGQDFQTRFIMPAAKQALDKLAPQKGGETSKGRPAEATHTGVGSVDKKKHWLDASGKDLGLAE